MEDKANYIRRIEIDNLWGRFSVAWDLHPDVNILSGINGVGKTTILNRVVEQLKRMSAGDVSKLLPGVRVFFNDESAPALPFDVIRSYDRPLLTGDFATRMVNAHIRSELDWQLYLLDGKYLDYQLNIAKALIEVVGTGQPVDVERAAALTYPRKLFQDTVDELFACTGKVIDRTENAICFLQGDQRLLPYQLSSGEKQLLLILLTALVQDGKPSVLFMDEPEASLHVDWQQKLVGIIRSLNPRAQIVLTTHSPALIMEGWLDAVTEVSDISSPIVTKS